MNKRAKSAIISLFLGVAFYAAPLSYAQEAITEKASYLECGHCTDEPVSEEGCEGGACDINVTQQLKYMPYYGIPEVIKTISPAYLIGAALLLIVLVVLVLI